VRGPGEVWTQSTLVQPDAGYEAAQHPSPGVGVSSIDWAHWAHCSFVGSDDAVARVVVDSKNRSRKEGTDMENIFPRLISGTREAPEK